MYTSIIYHRYLYSDYFLILFFYLILPCWLATRLWAGWAALGQLAQLAVAESTLTKFGLFIY